MTGFPGAFTPTCTETHLPEYLSKWSDFKGIRIAAMSVHDPFVMKAFAKKLNAGDKIDWISDGSGLLTNELGVGIDLNNAGFGWRCRRFTAFI